jgi:hypothetical protein
MVFKKDKIQGYFARLFRNSLMDNIYELLGLFTHRSRSAPHQSISKYPRQDQARPIFLFGFARSGTTTTQRVLSDVLGYNASFEPIGFNHSNWDPQQFSKIHLFLKGSPDIATLPIYGIGGGALSAIHTISNAGIRNEIHALLKGYIQHTISFYGHNVIIKELRLIANTPTIHKIASELDLNPIFLFEVCDIFSVLHTFYRLGGMVEKNDRMGVDELFAYRKLTYGSIGMFEEILGLDCPTRIDRLAVACLLDYEYMHHYAGKHPQDCFILDFEVFPENIQEIVDKFDLDQRLQPEIRLRGRKRYLQDRWFMKQLGEELNPDIFKILTDRSMVGSDLTPSNSFHFRAWITKLQMDVLSWS